MINRKIMLALGGLALIATPVLAAGLWPDFPLVGGSAVCTSTSTGVSGQVCTTTTPAGPSIVTGSETIPADTNLSQGQSPQTVRLPMAALNALPVSYVAILPTASTLTSTATSVTGGFIFTGSATLTPTIGVILPPSPIDGQQFRISSTQTINTLNVVGAGTASVKNAPVSLTPSTTAPYGYGYRYRASDTSWYRMQ